MTASNHAGTPGKQAARIDFPCPDYPVKIIGLSGTEFQNYVLQTLEAFAPGFDRQKLAIKDSGKATYQSITVLITATGEQQLSEMNSALRASHLVKIVL